MKRIRQDFTAHGLSMFTEGEVDTNWTPDNNATTRLLSRFDAKDVFYLKQLCSVDGNQLLLKVKRGRVVLKGNAVSLDRETKGPLLAKLREFTEMQTYRKYVYNRDGSVRRSPESNEGLNGEWRLFLLPDGGIDHHRYLINNRLKHDGILQPLST